MTDDQLPIGGAPPPAAGGGSLDRLINEYAVARTRREQVADDLKRLREVETTAELALFDAMERQGLRSAKHGELGLFILNDLAWAAVTDVTRARAWIEAEMPEILAPNHTKLALVVREAVRGEREMPPGIEAKYSRSINWRRT